MDLEDAGCRVHYLIRDRDGKFPALMDEILADAGIRTVLTGIRIPRDERDHGAVGAVVPP
ncbi:hypothetical protein ACIBI9_00570 [Nonomuraea sp. NPDC050451]|uniref:hypothetical protein n=1 Tax=Nonomuraea sp. NPDC050451 TaxID=3364364 RepID=UPI0037A4F9DE